MESKALSQSSGLLGLRSLAHRHGDGSTLDPEKPATKPHLASPQIELGAVDGDTGNLRRLLLPRIRPRRIEDFPGQIVVTHTAGGDDPFVEARHQHPLYPRASPGVVEKQPLLPRSGVFTSLLLVGARPDLPHHRPESAPIRKPLAAGQFPQSLMTGEVHDPPLSLVFALSLLPMNHPQTKTDHRDLA